MGDQAAWEALFEPATVVVRAMSDAPMMEKETFRIYKGDEVELPLYGLNSWAATTGRGTFRRIVDVGGNYGAVAIALARLFPAARIVVLEPNPLLCRFILWNVREKGLLSQIWPICAGLGGRLRNLAMEVCNGPWRGPALTACVRSAMSTFPREKAPPGKEGRIIEVPVLTMDEVLAQLQWESVDLLKIDCEGCEWSTLLVPRTWTASHVVGEVHFRCALESCWLRGYQPERNCTRASFRSLLELVAALEACRDHVNVSVDLEAILAGR